MSNHDQRFFDMFMVVIGGLIVVTVALIFIARYMAGNTQLQWVQTQPETEQQVLDRIAPIGRVALPGDDEQLAAAAATPTVAPVAEKLTGPQVYNAACLACHGAGIAGAPRMGEAGDWTARLAQGMDVIYRHSLEGFTGSAGYMPPKGGRADLSDEEIMAAVDFMIAESR